MSTLFSDSQCNVENINSVWVCETGKTKLNWKAQTVEVGKTVMKGKAKV